VQHGATVAAVAARCNGALYREPVAPHHRTANTGATKIQALERAALDGHHCGQSWQAYFAANVGAITAVIRANPGGWAGLRDRLLALLVSGETSGRLAVGDSEADEAPVVAMPVDDTTTEARLLWSPEPTP
jgi:hypothetical protein